MSESSRVVGYMESDWRPCWYRHSYGRGGDIGGAGGGGGGGGGGLEPPHFQKQGG